ncbi:MAG: sugar ABC transporter substrate-binding protein [Treponema sp.]|jgi:multiple sugar transport system substrate-binding protein|nr:sugar ABC transporter substrate-binding protein [Treponema sp.]
MKRIALLVVVCLVSGALLFAGGKSQAGSGPAEGGKTLIRWAFWGNDTRIQLTQQAVEEYMKANPNVLVNIEPAGGTGDMFNRVDTQLAGGNGPDIIQMGGNFPDYVAKNAILPLEPYGSSGKGLLNTSVIDPGSLAAGSLNGHLYGVSVGITIPALVYNKTILQKAGAPLPPVSSTYDEFRAYLAKIKPLLPAGIYPMSDFGSTASGSTAFGYWLRYNGTPIYNAATKTTAVTAAVGQKYLELWKDYRDNGLIPPAEIAAQYPATSDDTNDFIAGKTAINFAVSNSLANIQSVMADDVDLVMPPGAAATKALWPQLSQVMTVNKDSKNIEEAVKFINFMVNSPVAGRILGNNRGASASSTYRSGIVATGPDEKINGYLNVAGPYTTPETDHLPNDTELNSTLYLIYQEVYYNKLSAVEGGQKIYDTMIRLINK